MASPSVPEEDGGEKQQQKKRIQFFVKAMRSTGFQLHLNLLVCELLHFSKG